ncbi:MAG: hypothetical protein HYZ38_06550 [Mycobacterium sp.]|nr:hypothetical protein [Mycobacterium sp.]
MKKSVTASVGVTTLLVTAAIGMAGPALADDAAPTSSKAAVMPGPLKGTVLSGAIGAVSDAISGTRSANLPVVYTNVTGPAQVIYNTSNWYVCYQSPGAGKTISAKAKGITLYVRRPNEKCS